MRRSTVLALPACNIRFSSEDADSQTISEPSLHALALHQIISDMHCCTENTSPTTSTIEVGNEINPLYGPQKDT